MEYKCEQHHAAAQAIQCAPTNTTCKQLLQGAHAYPCIDDLASNEYKQAYVALGGLRLPAVAFSNACCCVRRAHRAVGPQSYLLQDVS